MNHYYKTDSIRLAIGLLLVLVVTLTACGPADSTAIPTRVRQPTAAPALTDIPATERPLEPTPGPTATPEPIELHMTWWGSQTRHDRTIAVIDLFHQKHPWITITYEFSSFGDYWPMLSAKAAAGELPDVMQQDYAYYRQYVADKLILPLDPYVSNGIIDLGSVPVGALEGGRAAGQLYALSLGTNSQSFVIDVDLFEQAGVPLPRPDWTWKDFEEINLAIHEKLGIWGNGGGLENPQLINALYLSRGQGLYSDSGTALGFNDPQPLIDYFTVVKTLQDAGAMYSFAAQTASPPTLDNNGLVTGEAAMYFAHSNQLVGLWKAAGEDRNLMMVPIPRAVDATQSANYFKPAMFFSIGATSKHPKESAMFIDFFTNSVEANEILLAERGVPISTVVQDALRPKLDKSIVAAFDFLSNLEVSAIRPPDPTKHNEIVDTIYDPLVFEPMIGGQITPEQAVAVFMEETNPVLAGQ